MNDIIIELIRSRIEQNEKLFTSEEIKTLKENIQTISKIYLVALIDTKM